METSPVRGRGSGRGAARGRATNPTAAATPGMPCWFGKECAFIRKGKCNRYHPPSDIPCRNTPCENPQCVHWHPCPFLGSDCTWLTNVSNNNVYGSCKLSHTTTEKVTHAQKKYVLAALKIKRLSASSALANARHAQDKEKLDALEGKLKECEDILQVYENAIKDLPPEVTYLPTWFRLHERAMKGLPIYAYYDELVQALDEKRVLILSAATGSGKSTQVVQYFADRAHVLGGRPILCTQPRKLAAEGVADYVSQLWSLKNEELLPPFLKEKVGNKVMVRRGVTAERKQRGVLIEFLTETTLLRALSEDPTLTTSFATNIVVVDEVHERTVGCDLILGMLHKLLRKRPEFKVVVMSATLDMSTFTNYFRTAVSASEIETFEIPGRTFPVTVEYHPPTEQQLDYDKQQEATMNKAVDLVMQLVGKKPSNGEEGDDEAETEDPNDEVVPEKGDVIVFVPRQQDTTTLCKKVQARIGQQQVVLHCLHAAVQPEHQKAALQPDTNGNRKVIFSTAIAETSLTIDGLKHVIDTGFAREMVHNSHTGMSTLQTVSITQASAKQRAGRAGRLSPGKCYRLYSPQEFEEFDTFTLPEVKRVPLSLSLLRLLMLGETNIANFNWLDKPPEKSVSAAFEELVGLRAVSGNLQNACLTEIGRELAQMDLQPSLGAMVLAANKTESGFGDLMLGVACLLPSITRIIRRNNNELIPEKLQKWVGEGSDVQFLGHVWTWLSGINNLCKGTSVDTKLLNSRAREMGLHGKPLKEAMDTYLDTKMLLSKKFELKKSAIPPSSDALHTAFLASTPKLALLQSNQRNKSKLDFLQVPTCTSAMIHSNSILSSVSTDQLQNQQLEVIAFSKVMAIEGVSNPILECVVPLSMDKLATLSPFLFNGIDWETCKKLRTISCSVDLPNCLRPTTARDRPALINICTDIVTPATIRLDTSAITISGQEKDVRPAEHRLQQWVQARLQEKRAEVRVVIVPGAAHLRMIVGAGGEPLHLLLDPKLCVQVRLQVEEHVDVDTPEKFRFTVGGSQCPLSVTTKTLKSSTAYKEVNAVYREPKDAQTAFENGKAQGYKCTLVSGIPQTGPQAQFVEEDRFMVKVHWNGSDSVTSEILKSVLPIQGNQLHRISGPDVRSTKKGGEIVVAWLYLKTEAAANTVVAGLQNPVRFPGVEKPKKVYTAVEYMMQLRFPSALWNCKLIKDRLMNLPASSARIKTHGNISIAELKGADRYNVAKRIREVIGVIFLNLTNYLKPDQLEAFQHAWFSSIKQSVTKKFPDCLCLVDSTHKVVQLQGWDIQPASQFVLEAFEEWSSACVPLQEHSNLPRIRRWVKKEAATGLNYTINEQHLTVSFIGRVKDVDTVTANLQNYLTHLEQELGEATEGAHTCPICTDVPASEYLLSCGCRGCQPCYESSVNTYSQVDLEKSDNYQPITCIACEQKYALTDISNVLQTNSLPPALILGRVHALRSKEAWSSCLDKCPREGCSDFVTRTKADVVVSCPSCGLDFCFKCHHAHPPLCPCGGDPDVPYWVNELENFILCRCKQPLERISGCQYLDCPCGAHMCVVCKKFLGASHASHDCTVSGYAFV